jgi:hypothetical protein
VFSDVLNQFCFIHKDPLYRRKLIECLFTIIVIA